MLKSNLQLRNVQNVAASKTALIDLPIGPRYRWIVLEHGYSSGTNTVAAAATNISAIRVKINGKVQRTYSGTELRDLNILNGTTCDCLGVPNTSPGVSFPIFLWEPWRKDALDADKLAWPTNRISSLQIEVDLSTASTPTLTASAVIDAATAEDVAKAIGIADPKQVPIVKVFKQGIAAAGTSFDYSNLDRRDALQQISLYPDSGGSNVTTQVDLRVNGAVIHELIFSANKSLLTTSGLTPAASGRTASITDLVLDHDDIVGSALNLNGTRDVTLTIRAGSAMSGTITAIVQKYGPPE